MADFFNAPSVDEVDPSTEFIPSGGEGLRTGVSGYGGKVGDEIVIQASDDFDPAHSLRTGVMGVSVALTDAEGNAIESGAATETPADSGRWVHKATAEVPTGTTVRIGVTATDRPGGKGAAAKEKAL